MSVLTECLIFLKTTLSVLSSSGAGTLLKPICIL